jgi:hypothetical protein
MAVGLNATNAYIPMLVQGNQWNELAENNSLPPEYQYEHTYITKLDGDTIIEGVTYYKLLKTVGFIPDPSSVAPKYKWETVGCIREDVDNQKVYYKPGNHSEFLLYDFDVEEGDIIQTNDPFAPSVLLSVQVDTVKQVLIDGQWRKQISVLSRATNLTVECICTRMHKWIEGVGCLDGFLKSTQEQNYYGGIKISLLCFSQNGYLVYKQKPEGTDIEHCYVWRDKPYQFDIGGQVDSVRLKTYTNENAEYIVYSSLRGGYDDYEIEYQEYDNSEIKIKIRYSQINPTDGYCKVQTPISIPFGILRGYVEAYIRYKTGGTEENPEYTDYRQIGDENISLEDLGVSNAAISGGITVSQNELRIKNGESKINSGAINDLSGRTIAKLQIANDGAVAHISALPQGVYFVSILTGKGLVVRKFVKE